MARSYVSLFGSEGEFAPAGGSPTSVTIGNNTGNTFTGTEDAKIVQTAATTNFSGNVQLECTKFGAGDHTNSVIRFTGLSSITGPVTVSAATINIFQESGSGTYVCNLQRLLRTWVNAQVTWNEFSTGNAWTTGGGESVGNDVSGTVSASASSGGGAVGYIAYTAAQLLTDVQNIINGVNPNNGWLFIRSAAGEDSLFKVFTSSDGTDTNRPYLAVTYS